MAKCSTTGGKPIAKIHASFNLAILLFVVVLSMLYSSAFTLFNHHLVDAKEGQFIIAKSRYSAGLVCRERGWEFCATWANTTRIPGSRIA
ncbi:hypothetical protein [Shewanella sp. 10N.286.54.B9]|uniref:hypothetical protein n=1 Tax=Shewanella sp. 10N.286.54.B9 TaxID=3229719 RepID=UPI003553411C